jgi:hypothetical protein
MSVFSDNINSSLHTALAGGHDQEGPFFQSSASCHHNYSIIAVIMYQSKMIIFILFKYLLQDKKSFSNMELQVPLH